MELVFDRTIKEAYPTYVCTKCGAPSHSSVFSNIHAETCSGQITFHFGPLHASFAILQNEKRANEDADYNDLSVTMLREHGFHKLLGEETNP